MVMPLAVGSLQLTVALRPSTEWMSISGSVVGSEAEKAQCTERDQLHLHFSLLIQTSEMIRNSAGSFLLLLIHKPQLSAAALINV